MAQYKVPGVYIVEEDAFPNSVVEVDTAVPAFIGYTQQALNGTQSLKGVPWLVQSMADFESYFGKEPPTQFKYAAPGQNGKPYALTATGPLFYLYYSLRLYFDNGGAPCYIVSVGDFKATPAASDFTGVLDALTRQPEPTMLVAPDVMLLGANDGQTVRQQFLAHCDKMQSRIAIFDILNGNLPRDQANDQITAFRSSVGTSFLNYGTAYYPWLNTSVVQGNEVDFTALSSDTIDAFTTALTNEAGQLFAGPSNATKLQTLTANIKQMKSLLPSTPAPAPAPAPGPAPTPEPSPAPAPSPEPSPTPAPTPTPTPTPAPSPTPAITATALHQQLTSVSPLYVQVMNDIQTALNVLPPSGAMAGVYCRVDSTQGVFRAPANVSLNSVVSPTVSLSDFDQEDLNMPLDGKAVNAIRAFRGQGTIVWGARTLDGNSGDWKYINVRRTLIMIEQSIKYAMQPYVFAPNTATTWVTVQNMIENFLTNQWKAGALAGAKATDAFDVAIGLNVTMTGDDILNGLMKVVVHVAPVRPAEFIELTFQQKMQTS